MNWISVKDRLPEEWQRVIVADISFGIIHDYATACYHINKIGTVSWLIEDGAYGARNYDGDASIYLELEITHWIPLPKPPTETE